jgi:TIR domain
VNVLDSKEEIFDVFLCHNGEDKPAVRKICQSLIEEGVKPWLDELEIRPGTSWQTALGQKIKSIKSAAVFVGDSGIGPWQNEEIQALLSQFMDRKCPVIPVILPSAKTMPELPWTLANRHRVDFGVTDSQPLKRLIWGITGLKPAELSSVPSSEKPATMQEAAKCHLLPSKDDHAAACPGISKARLYPPLAESPKQMRRPNSKFFAAESRNTGWMAFSNTRFITKCSFC